MRKLITIALIMLAGLLTFTSCDLDPVGDYTFTYGYQYVVNDSDTAEELIQYLSDVLGDDQSFTISGRRSDAAQQALDRFQEKLPDFDEDYISQSLEDGDYMCLTFGLVYKSGVEILAMSTWVHEDKPTPAE